MSIATYLLKKRSVSFRRTLLGGVSLSAFFFVFYFLIGTHYLSIERSRGEGYHENDLYFQADSEYLVLKLFSTRGYYKRAIFHPLFPVMFNPSAHLVQKVITNPYVITSLYCALFGAICVLGSVYLFYHLSLPWPRSLLYAGFVGLTSSHLVFSTVPDTYIFSAAGLIALIILVVRKAPLWAWALVSVYLVGINIVNAVFIGIALVSLVLTSEKRWLPQYRLVKSSVRWKYLLRYLSLSGACFIGLTLIQKVVLDVWFFENSRKALEDIQYLFIPESLSDAWGNFVNLFEHLFYFNVIAPEPQVVQHARNPSLDLVSFRDLSWFDYPAFAWPGLFIWTGLLLLAAWSIYHYQLYRHPVVKVMMLCFLANAAIFYVYGDDFMLYSCEWTFFLVVLVFIGLEKVIQQKKLAQASLLFVLFGAMVLLNNLYFQWQLFSFHQF